jgi:hypothetical protein
MFPELTDSEIEFVADSLLESVDEVGSERHEQEHLERT